MIEEPPYPFLLTSAQNRHWSERARKRGRPDLAFHHDQLARFIQRLEEREAERNADRLPPLR